MADNTSRVTKIGAHLIIVDDGVFVTKFGAYAEILGEDVRITSSGAIVEMLGSQVRVTSSGAIAEVLYSPVVSMATYKASKTGNRSMHERLPDGPSGYAFDPKWSWWSVIKGKESRNYVFNPSFEIVSVAMLDAAVNWTSNARDNSETPGATAGKWTYKLVAPAATACSLDYVHGAVRTGVVTAIGSWTWSVDVYSLVDNFLLTMAVKDITTDRDYAIREWQLKSGWNRLELSWTNIAAQTVYVQWLTSVDNFSGNTLYLDRMQLENIRYATTYFDGDMIGWEDKNPNFSFYWVGDPHETDSVRVQSTNAGGEIVSLSEEVNFLTTAILGLGMYPIDLKTIELDSGKEILVDSQAQPRDFTVVGRIYGCDYAKLSRKRNEIIKLVNPQNNVKREPIILRYQPTRGETGEPYGIPLDIKCAYKEGLEGNLTTLYQENIPLQFRASEPAAFEEFTMHSNIAGRTVLVDNQIIYRDADYLYQNLGVGGTTGFLEGAMWWDDRPMFVGSGGLWAGDIAIPPMYWDGSNWVEVSPGDQPNGFSFAIDGDTDNLFCGGSFVATVLGTTARRAARWSFATGWIELGDGFNAQCDAISYSKGSGYIYAAGRFTDNGAGSSPNLNYVAYMPSFQLANWTAMGLGAVAGRVRDILDLEDGRVVICGDFTGVENASGVIAAFSVAMWDQNAISPGTGDWSSFFFASGANNIGFDDDCHSLALGDDNMIYVVGLFTQNNGATYDIKGFARWNGSIWEEVAPLSDWMNTPASAHVMTLTKDRNGVMWITTEDDAGFTVPNVGLCWMFGYKDGVVFPPPYKSSDYTSPGYSPGTRCLAFNAHGEMLLGQRHNASGFGETMNVPERITIDYEGTFEAQLNFSIKGECEPSFIDFPDIGLAGIYFGERGETVIGDMETMWIRPDQPRLRVYTNTRATLLSQLNLPATTFSKMKLLPNQINRINIFIPEITLTPDMYAFWHNKFASIDPGAIE